MLSGSMRSFSRFRAESALCTYSFWSARRMGGGSDSEGVDVIPFGFGRENYSSASSFDLREGSWEGYLCAAISPLHVLLEMDMDLAI